jgi:hypothetical protein
LITHHGQKLSTVIYYKPTDTHQYLHFASCHPRHTKRVIPYNLARRICTNVNEESTRNERLNEMQNYLLNHGYPKNSIQDWIQKATNMDQQQLINPPTFENAGLNALPLVTTHNPKNRNITLFVKHLLNTILQTDDKMSKALEKFKFINSKRQAKTLRRILCKSHFRKNNTFAIHKCSVPRCGTCQYVKEESVFKIGSRDFKVNNSMSCN